ncbi:unnamed protein product, partial [Tetraodon nigroviridis]
AEREGQGAGAFGRKAFRRQRARRLAFAVRPCGCGQLDKRTQQLDVACLLEEFGQIESINVS